MRMDDGWMDGTQWEWRRPEVTPADRPISESSAQSSTLVLTYPWSSASRLRFISRDTLCWAASCRASSIGTFDTGLFDISVELTPQQHS